MSPTLTAICYVVALVCFGLAAFGVETRVALVPAGLFFWLLPLAWAAIEAT